MDMQLSFLIKSVILLLLIFIFSLIYYTIHIGNKHIKKGNRIKINKTKIIPIIIGIIIIYLFLLLVNRYSIIADTILTIIISAILAYLLNPIIDYFEKHKISRNCGILILYLIIVGIFFVFIFSIIPKTTSEMKKLMITLPMRFNNISNKLNNIYIKFCINIENMPSIFKSLEDIIFKNINNVKNIINNNIDKFFKGVISTFSKFISLILTPIVTFYFLKDKDYFVSKLSLTIPKKWRRDVKELLVEIDNSLSKFIRGRLILALYVGVATTILLLVLRIDFAFVIGMLTGVADIIPYIGPLLGFLPAVFFAFLNSPIKALWVSIIFLGIQWVENNILAPKIIGESTGIHPLTVLLSLVIGGGLFGVVGMIFSIPVVAILKILIDFFVGKIGNMKTED